MTNEEFEWKDYLDYSEHLLNNCSQDLKGKKLEQAHFRTIISKSYYYAYHSCKEFVEKKFPKSSKDITGNFEAGMHKALGLFLTGIDTNLECKDYSQDLKDKIKDLGKKFNNLKDYRIASDYKLKGFYNSQTDKNELFNPSYSSTRRYLNKVKSFISDINNLEQDF